jgi:hypothetical protein
MRHITMLLVLLMIASAADRDLAGRYSGDWKSSGSGGNGAFRLSLEPAPDGTWKCEVTFTFAGEDVKTIMRQVKVEQSKLEVTYDFVLLDNTLRSRITGEWNGKAFAGKYQTTAVDGGEGVDDGVWNAALVK